MAPRALVNRKVVHLCDKHFGKLPGPVQKVCYYAMVVFFNMVSLVGGSFWVDLSMKNEKPHLNRLSHLVSSEKLLVQSPHKLGMEVIPKVNLWRAQKIAELKENGASEEAIHKVQWGLPLEI